MATIGDLVVNLTANSRQFSRGIKNAGNAVAGFATRATKQIATVGAAFAGLAIAKGIKEAASLENLTVQFEVLLGSLEEAENLMSKIRTFGAQTPFQTEDIATGAKQLLNAGVAAEEILPTLEILGDLAAAGGTSLQDVAFVFSQVRSAGRLMGQDLNQLLNANIPVIAALAEEFGVAESEVRDLVSTGAVTYERLFSAMQRITGEGGRLNGMTQKLSQTTSGLWSTVKDNISQASAELGKFIIEQFKVKESMQAFSEFMTQTFLPTFKAIATNWQALWDLLVSSAALQLVRIMEDVKHFGMQVAAVAEFIWQTMLGAFETIGDAAGTMFANIAAGNFENPMEGFENQMGKAKLELPERTESELEKELNKQLEASATKFGEGFAESMAASRAAVGDGAAGGAAGGGRAGQADRMAQQQTQLAEAATEGSQSAFSSILKNVLGKQDKAADKTAKNTEETVALLGDISDSVGNRGDSPTVVSSFV